MFTGIVEEVGAVTELSRDGDSAQVAVSCAAVLDRAAVGDSISVDGVCLTLTEVRDDGFTADLMVETLRVTTLGRCEPGTRVNLERAMAADGRFGGHLVQGHVDGVGRVTERVEQPGTVFLSVDAPPEVVPYLAPKGSVAVQGVSLTLASVDGQRFRVGLIPHTTAATNLGELRVGDEVNLEADIVAKYVERLLRGGDDDRG